MVATRSDIILNDASKTRKVVTGLTIPTHSCGLVWPTDPSPHLCMVADQLRVGLDVDEWPPPAVVANMRYQEWFVIERPTTGETMSVGTVDCMRLCFGVLTSCLISSDHFDTLPAIILQCKIWSQLQLQGVTFSIWWCWYNCQEIAP